MTPEKILNLLQKADELVLDLPGGIDEDADPTNRSPADAIAHTGGLVHRTLREAIEAFEQLRLAHVDARGVTPATPTEPKR